MAGCDISKTAALESLCSVPSILRDDDWREGFLKNVAEAACVAREPQVFQGPDGFPYFALDLPKQGQSFQAVCIALVADQLIDNGVGVVVNPREEGADWVFSLGAVYSWYSTGAFYPEEESLSVVEGVQAEGPVIVGSPSEAVLPTVLRAHMRRFITDGLDIRDPRVALVQFSDRPAPELLLSITKSDFPTEEIFEAVANRLTWFLPTDRQLTFLDEISEFDDALELL